MEVADDGARGEWLVDEHRYDGRLWQLLSEAGTRCPVGLGANLPEDAIYPINLFDDAGKPLEGSNKYTLHFDKGGTPPVGAFWSVTLYDADGFQVANPLNKFDVASWMPLKYNADGSLDLYFQNESPGPDKEVNWVPAPKGAFNLLLRMYAPKHGRADRQVESAAGDASAIDPHAGRAVGSFCWPALTVRFERWRRR